jgi:DNA-binding transcriptional regulator/RsmH inhibitor MraZ
VADEYQGATPVLPPTGMLTGRIDEKGRLKLATDVIAYFNKIAEKTLYVTSLDGRMAQIYLMSSWRQNEKFFEENRTNPKAARHIAFLASAMGAEVAMDNQGRVQLPAKLRKQLKLEEGGVYIGWYRNSFQILSEDLYQEKFGVSLANAEEEVYELESAGLL